MIIFLIRKKSLCAINSHALYSNSYKLALLSLTKHAAVVNHVWSCALVGAYCNNSN